MTSSRVPKSSHPIADEGWNFGATWQAASRFLRRLIRAGAIAQQAGPTLIQPSRSMLPRSPHSSFVSAALLAIVPALSIHAEVSFEKDILPVFKERCLDCHQAPREVNGKKKEPKAGLRLDAAWAIMKGGENGAIVKPKDSSKSSLHEVLVLPADDDSHMPPKGDPLTAAQIALVKQWIDEGANFGEWKGSTEGMPAELAPTAAVARKRAHEEFYKALEKDVKPAAADVLKKAQAAGAQVATLTATSPLVRVDFLTGVSNCTDAKVAELLPMADNIAHLDLGRTAITDAALASVAKFKRLAKLDLRQTKITDKGVESLTSLTKLQTLNLYGTEVTDASLDLLSKVKSLKQVFLWQTKATEAGAKKLQGAIPGVVVVVN